MRGSDLQELKCACDLCRSPTAPASSPHTPLLHAAATPAQHTCARQPRDRRTPGGHALAVQQQGAQLLLLLLAALHVLKLLLQLLLHALTLQTGDLLSVRTCVDL